MAATATASSMGPRYAPPDPTLPKPWKGLVDGKTGYLYFWNPETNVTQYERPSSSAAPPKSSSVPSSSVQVQHTSQGSQRGRSPDFSDRYDRNGSGGSNDASRNNQSSKGGSYSSHSVPTGTNAAANVSYSVKGHGASDAAAVLSPESYRSRHEITVTGDNVPPPLASFGSSGFPPEVLREVQNAGFSAPTPIQAQSWPIALQSRDIVAIAKTGSGKTLGYLIPAFVHLKRCGNNSKMGPTALVLSPTRELATQIQDEAVKFGKSSRISCACLYGGAPKGPQLRDIDRGADIVVATPGRLNDILEMRRISLHQVSYLVLDEADRMLDMGFEPQIRKIVNEVPNRRQTLMFTATWPKEVRKIAADLLVKPVQVNIGNVDELVANKSITQHVEVLPLMEKQRRLEHILRSQDQGSKIIIFCSTKKMCDQLARTLTRQFGAAAIHGDKSQAERDHVLSQFRTGRSPVLVATDVAARGLDIKDIRVVVNYDFPTGVEDYVHRIGRTGRAGATGLAYTFFGDQDAKYATDLIKVLEGANQKVPPELRDMSSRGGSGMGRSRRWGSGGRGGRSDSGYGGRNNDSGYGGRGSDSNYGARGNASSGRGGRGFDYDSQRNDRGLSPDKGSKWSDRYKSVNRERSRSPDRAALPQHSQSSFHKAMMERGGWGDSDRNKSSNRDRSRSPSPYRQERTAAVRERSPVHSFHRSMMGQGQSSPPRQRARSPYRNSSPSQGGGRSYNSPPKEWGGNGGEVEEGMIPEEDGMIGQGGD
ncbi:DEAD-box ATP-dependent RNA helicase 46 [Vigna radiata var. radiata]|uniref:RNA helicase n=1 Tax=Vigna radiata var. radiata TaxID=3916 RepID=A0A1S3V4K3_VIGRR|nr:DEAD-box ATP-dependent RNA helicase 46 [Vigna radiata var. radiata]XP_022637097.1 DEAD-box ATP-dependent RNA helicase 46 [Vigna radiata var. radiata]